jgi:hypothetical protein
MGYVFSYQSKDFLSTKNDKYLLIGNAPLIIDKQSGNIFETSFRFTTSDYMRIYSKLRDQPELYNAVVKNMDVRSDDEIIRKKCLDILVELNIC